MTTTTIPHTTYGIAYDSVTTVTLCDDCAASGEYPITQPVETYRADDPRVCERCGLVYDIQRAETETQ